MALRDNERIICSEDAFTLIELLVVITIIGLLVVALIPAFAEILTQGGEAATKNRIELLKLAIDKYERETGEYPPSDFAEAAKGVKVKADSVNAGIECLIIHLHQKNLGRAASLEEHRDWLSNTDGDDNGAVIPLLNSSAKVEVVDYWDMPIAYIHNNSYAKSFTIQPQAEEGSSLPTETGRAWKVDGAHLNPRSYQLISAGRDMIFNTDDDISFPENPLRGGG